MGVHKISSFVRLSVYHLQVHLLFFRALCLSASIIPSLFSHFLTVCLPAYLPVLVFKPVSPICHVSAATAEDGSPTPSRLNHWINILLHISFLPFECALTKAQFLWFLPDPISALAPEDRKQPRKGGRARSGCRFSEPPLSDESSVDSGSGASNVARQLLQKYNYPNARPGCSPVPWLAGGWNRHSGQPAIHKGTE